MAPPDLFPAKSATGVPVGVPPAAPPAGGVPVGTVPSGSIPDLFPGHTTTAPTTTPAARAPAPPPAHSGGGSLWGSIAGAVGSGLHEAGHVLGQGAHDVGVGLDKGSQVANAVGTGLYTLGKDVVAPGTHPSWAQVGAQWEHALGDVFHPERGIHSLAHPERILGADPAGRDIAGMANSTVSPIAHPLRSPANTALSLLALGTLGAGSVARAGYALDALGAAREAEAAGAVGRAGELRAGAAKALGSPLHKPPTAARFLKVPSLRVKGGGEGPPELFTRPVQLHASSGHLVRAIQGAHDALLQHALDRSTITGKQGLLAKYADRRIAGAEGEGTRITMNLRSVMERLLAASGKKFDNGVPKQAGQLALLLRSANVTGEEAARYWRAQAAQGVNPKLTSKLADLAQGIHDEQLIHVRDDGNVGVNREEYPLLGHAERLMTEAQQTRADIIREHDLMAPGARQAELAGNHDLAAELRAQADRQMQDRLDVVGEKITGAHYVKPTPGRLGKPSQALLKQRAYVARLEKLHETALAKTQRSGAKAAGPNDVMIGNRLVGPGKERELPVKPPAPLKTTREPGPRAEPGATISRPRTKAEAEARLTELEKEHNAAVDQVAEGMFGKTNIQEAGARGKENARAERQQKGLTRAGQMAGKLDDQIATLRERLAKLEEEQKAKPTPKGPDRLASLQKRIDEAAKKRQSLEGKRFKSSGGSSGRKSVFRQSIADERRSLAEQKVQQAIEAEPNHPALARWAARTAEIDKLRAALNPEPDFMREPGAPAAKPDYGTVETKAPPPEPRPVPRDVRVLAPHPRQLPATQRVTGPGRVITPNGGARADRIGGALSVARDKLEQMERAHANRIEPTGMVGGNFERQGQGFVSLRTSEKRAAQTNVAAARGIGGVIPRARRLSLGRPATGAGVAEGRIPMNTTLNVSRALHEALRFLNTEDFRGRIAKLGGNVRRTKDDILVADPAKVQAAEIPENIDVLLGRKVDLTKPVEPISEAEHASLSEAAKTRLFEMIPGLRDGFAHDYEAPLGEHAPAGYVWVPRQMIPGEITRAATARNGLEKFADSVNSAVTAATVYLKLGHFPTRALTNLTTNVVQGSAHPGELARLGARKLGVEGLMPTWIGQSVRLAHELSDEELHQLAAITGTHGYAALPHEGTSVAAKFATKGANWWAQHVDAPFRINAVLHELRQVGIDTPEGVREVLHYLDDPAAYGKDAAWTTKVDWAVRHANRSAIMYDGLNDFEKRYVVRLLWFYPWTKGATRFAFHTLSEHPLKAAGVVALGVKGRNTENAGFPFGYPTYEQSLAPVGNNKTSDFSSLTPYGTLGQVGQIVRSPQNITQQLNPTYAGLAKALADAVEGKGTGTAVKDFGANATAPTPEAQIVNALLHPQGSGAFPVAPNRIFGNTWQSALLRSLVGASFPRGTNANRLHTDYVYQHEPSHTITIHG